VRGHVRTSVLMLSVETRAWCTLLLLFIDLFTLLKKMSKSGGENKRTAGG